MVMDSGVFHPKYQLGEGGSSYVFHMCEINLVNEDMSIFYWMFRTFYKTIRKI